jgi:hypothetical protein
VDVCVDYQTGGRNTFNKASFALGGESGVSVDDPQFWEKVRACVCMCICQIRLSDNDLDFYQVRLYQVRLDVEGALLAL